MLDTGLARLFPGNFEIILLPLPTIGFLLSWRLATEARGASTGISGSAPPPLLDWVSGAHAGRQAALARWPVPLAAPQTGQDQASGGHPW